MLSILPFLVTPRRKHLLKRFSLEWKCGTLTFAFCQTGRFVFITSFSVITGFAFRVVFFFLMIFILMGVIHYHSPYNSTARILNSIRKLRFTLQKIVQAFKRSIKIDIIEASVITI